MRPEETVILVLDDEDIVRKFICAALSSEGYAVLEATSAAEAIAVANQAAVIDLLIADHLLKDGSSGPDAANRIVRRHPRMQVLHISGLPRGALDTPQDLTAGIRYIAKPFGPRVLLAAVREVLEAD